MKKKIALLLSAVILAGVLLFCLQALLMPKYMEGKHKEGALIGEYYANAGNNDVIFIGDCEVYENFSPITMWEKYGITSYIRGSAQQLIWQSYYLMEETFQYETPKVMVFNVLSMKYDTNEKTGAQSQREAYNRMTLDGMEWSWAKVNAIKASMTEGESFLSYVFPLLRFHSRWNDLTGEDLQYLLQRAPISHNGYLMQNEIKGGKSDREGKPLADYTLPSTSLEYLEKMRALCEEKGIELILVKAPTNDWKYYWYDEWDAQIADYAEKNQLSYYNFIPLCDEIGIDWQTDTYDVGVHLNVFGAEKLTAYFGKILAEKHGLVDHRADASLSAVWQDKLDAYYQERNSEQ